MANNNVTYIGGRVKSAAKNDPYVAEAKDIIDESLHKDQQDLNEYYDEVTHDVYRKEEVNNIVSRTPETDVIVIDIPAASQGDIAGWLDANTPSGTDPETGRSVRANKLYRVPGPTNTTYSEWAWDGEKYVMLANKDYGIDKMPKAGNNRNTVESNGVSQCLFENINNIGIIKNKLNTPLSSGFVNVNGGISTSTYGAHTDFIHINQAKKYFVRSGLSLNWCTAYYSSDSEEGFISSQEYYASTDAVDFPLTIPTEARYMRVTMQADAYLPQGMKGVFEYEVRKVSDEIDNIPSKDIVNWLNNFVGYNHVGEEQIIGVEDCSDGLIDINGAISSSEYAVYSDFIEITSVKKYFVRGQGNPGWYYGYYSDKSAQSFISSQQSAPDTTFFEDIELVVPEGARYVRVTLPKNSQYFPIGLFEYTLDNVRFNFEKLSDSVSEVITNIGFVDEKVNSDELSGYVGFDGNVYSSEYAKHTEFIQIDDDKRNSYIVKTTPAMGWCCAFYESNNGNSFISAQWYGPTGEGGMKDIELVIPSNAHYLMATLSSDNGIGVYIRNCVDIKNQYTESTKNLYDELLNTFGYNYEEIPTTFTSGFINSVGEAEQSSFGKYTDFIPVNPLFDYIVRTWMTPLWYVAYYADSDVNSFISSQQYPENTGEAQDLNLNIPVGAKYLRATIQVGGYGVFMKKISNDSLERTYIVDKSGNGDFTTFYGALKALQNDNSKKKIIVLGGVYDVFEEMGGQAFIDSIPSDTQSSDWRQYCTLIPDNTKVIGQGEVVIKCELPNGTPDNVRIMISPINVSGSVEIENMTIIAANVRYNIHDEGSAIPRFNNTRKIYRNIKLWQTSSITGTIFGCGFNPNCSYEFHNCIFDGDNAYQALFMHTNAGNDYTSILMSNCVFNVAQNAGESIRLHCGAHDNGNAFVTVNMNNVLANRQVHITANEYANTFKVIAANCNFDSINIEAASNPYIPKFY